jgi:CheY-like chemotaxis protein
MSTKRFLLVEDEPLIALDIELTLQQLGHVVLTTTSNEEATALLQTRPVDLAILDFRVRDGDTSELAGQLHARAIPFVVCSGSAALQELGEAFRDAEFLPKPYTTEGLLRALEDVSSR